MRPSSVLQRLRDGLHVLLTLGPGAVLRGLRRIRRARLHAGAAADAAPPQPMPMLFWHLDSPNITQPIADDAPFEVRGWIAASGPVRDLRFADEALAREVPLTVAARPDLAHLYGLPMLGFSATCPYPAVAAREIVSLLFECDGQRHEIVVPAYRPGADPASLKRAKLERVLDLLQCPECGSRSFAHGDSALTCRGCASKYARSAQRLDFLTPALRAQFDIVDTANVSGHGYHGELLNIVYRLRHGLILDCGAGKRDRYFGNVVNYEIAPYDSTDVLGVGERLPFADESFDAVFSLAVLEHVKDPFACGREIVRVLKPGGILYCIVPLLQPVHGYPHHYYNMTLAGLANLFGERMRVDNAGPSVFGQPVYAISWILNRYLEGLPPEKREAFKDMRVAELLDSGHASLGKPFVTALSAAAREELSCANAMIAVKR